jgi:hypothetical protein
MSMLRAFVTELRERRLLPLVIVLVAGIVAVPVVLAKTQATSPAPAPRPPGVPVSSNPGGPSVSLASNAPATPPHGLGRDPFTPPFGTAAHASTSTLGLPTSLSGTPATPTSSAGGAGGGTSSTGGGGTSPATPSTTSSPTTGGTTPMPTAGGSTPPTGSTTPTTTGPADPPDQPSATATVGLSSTQAYHVTLAITNTGGGLDTISPLERLSILPSRLHPLLVELGVLAGGRRVLFAVQPGAVVRGPGRCTPGPIDCQILSLASAQTETLSSANGTVSHVLLAVTSVTRARYPSSAAAKRARRLASAAGRKLIHASTLSALSLFQYDPARGAVFDLRNLGVGGR